VFTLDNPPRVLNVREVRCTQSWRNYFDHEQFGFIAVFLFVIDMYSFDINN
jgi:hypothetical protein